MFIGAAVNCDAAGGEVLGALRIGLRLGRVRRVIDLEDHAVLWQVEVHEVALRPVARRKLVQNPAAVLLRQLFVKLSLVRDQALRGLVVVVQHQPLGWREKELTGHTELYHS